MKPVSVTITIQPQDIPALVCSERCEETPAPGYSRAIAEALASSLGVQDFLFQPQRIYELRRHLWAMSPSI